MQPRAYQTAALESVLAHFRTGNRAVLVVSPTGSGKTAMGSMLVARHLSKLAEGSAVWLVHRQELIRQAAKTLRSFGLRVGTPGDDPGAPVQVCMAQTLTRRRTIPYGTLVIVDEAHHYSDANGWTDIVKAYLDANAYIVGFTATPARHDDQALHGFKKLVVAAQISELQAAGHLVPLTWRGPDRCLAKNQLASRPVDAYLQHARGRQAVVFAPHVKAAREYMADFHALGVGCDIVTGDMPDDERASVIGWFDAGNLDVLCNVNVLTEGWDSPNASCCIVARRCGSQALWIQMTGRVLRPAPGKKDALLLDLCGMAHVLGRPDDRREYALTGAGIRLVKAPTKDRLCKACGYPLGDATICPDCGREPEQQTPHSIGEDLGEWQQRYAAAKDILKPTRYALALAGIMRKAEEAAAKGKPWKPAAIGARYKAVFGRWPDEMTMSMARRLNALAAGEFEALMRRHHG